MKFLNWINFDFQIFHFNMKTINLSVNENNISNIMSTYPGNITPDKRKNFLYCRICHEDGNVEKLIDPCECSGSLKLVHTSCLEKWLSISNSNQCEICKYIFEIRKKNKPIHQSLFQWWKATNIYQPKGIVADFICLILLTPLCLITSYLCGIGAISYNFLRLWESIGLIILGCMLMCTYFLWLFITIRFHFKCWRHWCKYNQNVELLIKHRIKKQYSSKIMKIIENQTSEENQEIVINQCFDWFEFDNSNDFQQRTSYV